MSTPAVKVVFEPNVSDAHLPNSTSKVPDVDVSATPEVAAIPEEIESSFWITVDAESSQAPRLVAGVYGVVVFDR